MTFLEQLKRMERIDCLIRKKSTGSPSELAARLNMSMSQIYQIIKIMKTEMEAPIYYSKSIRSYCYSQEVKFICTFLPQEERNT